MSDSTKIPELLHKHISQIEIGDVLANLGEVLEIEQNLNRYSFVILRLSEKQVIKYDKDTYLVTVR